MRVGLFSPYSLTLPGGVQGQVLALGRALRRRGHVVRVLGPCDGPPPEPGVTPLGNSIPLAANGSVAPIAPDPAAALRTIRALSDEKFDVIHLHEPLVPGCNMTALIYKPCPIVATFHAAGVSASYRYLKPALRWVTKRIEVRAAVSEAAVALARQAIGGNPTVHLLFNGVETERFATAEPWPSTGPALFFIGRHEHRKGLEVLLEALPLLDADLQIWVGGTGPETDEFKRRYRDPRVQWLGRIGDIERDRRYRGAQVYCAPSLGGESFGVILLEAMAAGAPVVASDIEGYRNVATANHDALLVEPGDPEDLAKAVHRIVHETKLAAALVANGRDTAAQHSIDVLAERYESLYAQAMGRHAG